MLGLKALAGHGHCFLAATVVWGYHMSCMAESTYLGFVDELTLLKLYAIFSTLGLFEIFHNKI